ncbi:MAG: AI-2E family transporter [Christensenellaceae bacterium]|nr:AI-2E family transporter [Christensenellaceae bacterium]
MSKRWHALIISIIIFFLLLALDKFNGFLKFILYAISPIFSGILLVLILNTPVKLIETYLVSSIKKTKLKRLISLAIVMIIISSLVILLILLIYPEVYESIHLIMEKLKGFDIEDLKETTKNLPFIDFLTDQIITIPNNILNKASEMVINVFQKFTDVLKYTVKFIMGLGLGFLIMIHKESLKNQLFNLLKQIKGALFAKKIIAIISIGSDKFSRFLSGQLLESVIFGAFCYITFSILKLPFAPLLALILGVGNIVPIVGAYVAGSLGFLLVFANDPGLSLLFIISIIVIQQVEQWTTYPIIVGRYMRLNGFWILFGIVIGGGIFGIWGILLSIPALSFLHDLSIVFLKKRDKSVKKTYVPSKIS